MLKTTCTSGGPNGHLLVALGWPGALIMFEVAGGPYDNYPGREQAFGVCVRKERVPKDGYDVLLPITDFSVPENAADTDDALVAAFKAGIDGRPVYVGCMGGWGRTGLFLALMAKVAGEKDPVGYVRRWYTPHAVETKQQKAYVENYDMSWVRPKVLRYAWSKRVPVIGPIIGTVVGMTCSR